MNFGGEYSADGLQFDQAAKPPIGHPRMALCPCPSRARGGVAAEDAHCSERLTGSRRVRRPQPGNAGVEGRASDRPTDWRTPPWHHPQRTPGRKPGSGALIESTIGLRIVNLAKHQVPRALAGPSSELPWRRIVNFVQPWSQLTILRSITTKTHDYLRYREAHARIIDKNVRSLLPKPRKTVCFDRQRPKQTVFRIAHPPGRGRGAELEGLMQTARNQARLPLHVGTVNRAQTATRAGGKPV